MARTVAQLDQVVTNLVQVFREESTQSITDVQFETGVTDADAVYLDTNFNTWRRSIVDDVNNPDRAVFHGVANVGLEGNSVRIYGFESSDTFEIYNDDTDTKLETFVEGEFVYVSKRALGAYTQTPNNIQAGVAVGPDRFLLSSELDNATAALREIIEQAQIQNRVVVTEEERADNYLWTTLKARLDGTYSMHLDDLDLDDQRINAIQIVQDAHTAEFTASAGTAATLTSRLAVGMNPDGTLKSSVSVSTYTTETDTLTRVGSNAFSIPTDKTGIYSAKRTIRINDTIISHVNFSAFTTFTLVTLIDSVIPVTLTKIEYSFDPLELPLIAHTDLINVRTVDPSSSDTVRTKHVSDNDLKILTDGVADNVVDITANADAIDALAPGIVDSGENANGRYVKWADGTMVCFSPEFAVNNVNVALPEGSPLFEGSIPAVWTYPAVFFVAPPIVNVTTYSTAGYRTWGSIISIPSISVITFNVLCSRGTGAQAYTSAVAWGRWS